MLLFLFNAKVQEACSHRAAGKLPGGDSQQIQQHEPRGHALRAAHCQTGPDNSPQTSFWTPSSQSWGLTIRWDKTASGSQHYRLFCGLIISMDFPEIQKTWGGFLFIVFRQNEIFGLCKIEAQLFPNPRTRPEVFPLRVLLPEIDFLPFQMLNESKKSLLNAEEGGVNVGEWDFFWRGTDGAWMLCPPVSYMWWLTVLEGLGVACSCLRVFSQLRVNWDLTEMLR